MSDLKHDAVSTTLIVIVPGLFFAALLILGAALWIRSMVLRRKAGPAAPDWRDRMIEAWPEPIDIALDGPGFGDLTQLDYLEAWRQAGCPAVWPIPVVPGREAA